MSKSFNGIELYGSSRRKVTRGNRYRHQEETDCSQDHRISGLHSVQKTGQEAVQR